MNHLYRALLGAGAGGIVVGPPDPYPGYLRWSNPATWGGTLPQADATVQIPAGVKIMLDVPVTNTIHKLDVQNGGTFAVSHLIDTWLKAEQISIAGSYLSGSASNYNTRTHRRTLSGPEYPGTMRGLSHTGDTPRVGYPGDNGGTNRGFLVMPGGKYKIYGASPAIHKTRLRAHAFAGDTTLLIRDAVTWKAGDQIMITRTDHYRDDMHTMMRTLASDVNDTNIIHLTAGIQENLWGLTQYFNDDKTIKLTPGSFTTGPTGMRATNAVKDTLDTTAWVINMTRGHKANGLADDIGTTLRFGSHDMFMGDTTEIFIDGQEYDFCGQGGIQGRYPVHFHANQIVPGTSTRKPDFAPGQAVIQNTTVRNSFNRSVTFHACGGVKVTQFAAWNVMGHSAFFEEASEKNNELSYSHFHYTVDPGVGWRIKDHDGLATGLWATNLYNKINHNSMSDVNFVPAWVSINKDRDGFPGGCWGLSAQQDIHPEFEPVLEWDGNEMFCGGGDGVEKFLSQGTEQGGLGTWKFKSTINGRPDGPDAQTKFFRDFIWKCGGGIHHSLISPHYDGTVFADNLSFDLHGNTQFGEMINATFVSQSLNNASGNPGFRCGLVSYHGTFDVYDTTVYGYQLDVAPRVEDHETRRHLWMTSWLGGFDNYLRGMYCYSKKFTNIRSTEPVLMYQTPGPNLQKLPPFDTWDPTHIGSNRWGALATTHYDYEGTFFGKGPGKYMIVDYPFCTYGSTGLESVEPRGNYIAMVTTSTPQINIELWGRLIITGENINSSYYKRDLTFQHFTNTRTDVPGKSMTFPASDDLSNGVYCAAFAVGSRVRFFNPNDPTPFKAFIWTISKVWKVDTEWFMLSAKVTNAPTAISIYHQSILINHVVSYDGLEALQTSGWYYDSSTQELFVKVYPPSSGGDYDGTYDDGTIRYTHIEDWNYDLSVTC